MIERGNAEKLGATPDESGTNFAVFSSVAERVEVCLFADDGRQTAAFDLPESADDVWFGYLPGCAAGQRYGYRVHGPFDPDRGLRCNPQKLLIDPYARKLAGDFTWHKAVFDSNDLDSAMFIPKSVVAGKTFAPPTNRPRVAWSDMIIYEANVRGFTMRHSEVPEQQRGRFKGLSNGKVLEHLKSLGITSIELMPVHSFIDEHHLAKRDLRNFWGYNSISFLAPATRYAGSDPATEFREMVDAIHDAGMEVILDVVYNHTGESDHQGPTLGFRGLDNLSYYRTEPDAPGKYVNDTGTGNTLNADHSQVQQLILSSLRYWHRNMGVDGFRFDLAPVLGRTDEGFVASHPLLEAIDSDAVLHDALMIAEPWDPGPGGYQLGKFPQRWSEWNDRFRDDVRRFWRMDDVEEGFKNRVVGSPDLFAGSQRSPFASVNFVASHDGFTLADVVSYQHQHNEANGEDNADGHRHNFSTNHGIEGPTDDPAIVQARQRQRANMLATLFLSQGTPMLLAGDEFGQTQHGNNNAYAQDNETTWLDWSLLNSATDLTALVHELIALRQGFPQLRSSRYDSAGAEWLNAGDAAVGIVRETTLACLFNAANVEATFELPANRDWNLKFTTGEVLIEGASATLTPLTVAVLAVQTS